MFPVLLNEGFEADDELFGGEGLDNKIVRPFPETPVPVFFFFPAGENDNEGIREGTDFMQYLKPVNIRQGQIEKDDIRMCLPGQPDTFFTGGRGNQTGFGPSGSQSHRDYFRNLGGIFDKKYFHL